MKKLFALVALTVFTVIGSSAIAQESDALIAVLEKANSSSVSGTVTISEETAEEDSPLGGMGMVQVIGPAMGADVLELYTGDLELFLSDGAVTAVSKSEIPQFKVYQKDDQRLINHIYSDSRADVGQAADLLAQTFDFKSLIAEIKRASRVRVKDVDGGKRYRVTIDEEFFDPEAADAGQNRMQAMLQGLDSFTESVLEGVLIVTANADGELTALDFEIQYNDPMSGLMDMAMQGGGQLGPGDLEKSEEPGRLVVVEFSVSDSESEAAKTFAAEAAQLLK